jgi:sugar phosphate isomerase/epimerase
VAQSAPLPGISRRKVGEQTEVVMAGLSRRDFLQHAGGASAALAFMVANGIKLDAKPLGLPIGSQMWPHRAKIGTDSYAGLASILKDMKAIGIESVELVSPSGEFSSLTDGKQVRKVLDDNGIKSPSAHFRGVKTNLPTLIQWAHDIGMTHMSMASMGGAMVNGVTSLETVKKTCDDYNKLGAIAKKEGLQMMTHNEGFENSRLNDGRLTYPVLLEYLDPDVMKMQFQMSSMKTVGDPIMYFTMYPGRFASAHLQGINTTAGMDAAVHTPLTVKPTPEQLAAQAAARAARAGGRGAAGGGAGAGAAGGRAAAPAGRAAAGNAEGGPGALAVGEDTVDWPKVFQAAKIGGLQNYFVEQSWDLTVKSVAYLKTLDIA